MHVVVIFLWSRRIREGAWVKGGPELILLITDFPDIQA